MSVPAVTTRPRVVVVGGGIAGLTAALGVLDALPTAAVTVLEGSDRLGGKLRREPSAGHLVDVGAESMLALRPEGVDLAHRVGACRRRRGPRHHVGLGLVPGRAAPAAAGDPDGCADRPGVGPRHPHRRRGRAAARTNSLGPVGVLTSDVSVGDYVGARLGAAVVDRLVEPLLGGVYAGHAARLSLQATMPVLWQRATRGESLVAAPAARRRHPALPAHRRAAAALRRPAWGSGAAARARRRRAGPPRGDAAHRGGRPRALAHRPRLAARRRLGRRPRRSSRPTPSSCACPRPRPRGCSPRTHPAAAAALAGVETASSAVVTLAVERVGLERPAGVGLPRAAGRGTHHQGEHLQLPQVGLDRRAVRRGRAPARLVRPGPRGGRPAARRRRPRRPSRSPRSARPWAAPCPASSTRTCSAGAADCRSTPSATSTGSPRSVPTSRALPGIEVAGAVYDGVGIPAVVASATTAAAATVRHLTQHLSSTASRTGDHPA